MTTIGNVHNFAGISSKFGRSFHLPGATYIPARTRGGFQLEAPGTVENRADVSEEPADGLCCVVPMFLRPMYLHGHWVGDHGFVARLQNGMTGQCESCDAETA